MSEGDAKLEEINSLAQRLFDSPGNGMIAWSGEERELQAPLSDDKNLTFEDMAELAKLLDSEPYKSEQYWNPDTQKVDRLTRDFNPRNMLADLLRRKK